MERPVLISACLLGRACRYDGRAVPDSAIIAFAAEHDVVAVCPEQLGGLPTPRTPSEIRSDGRVVDREGHDRTAAFEAGAAAAVAIAREHGCTRAILKENSPSCGATYVYDGTFSGTLVPGEGLTARALRAAQIEVIPDQNDLKFEVQ